MESNDPRETGLRASDAEREPAVERLKDAAAEGRLTLEELADRTETATASSGRSVETSGKRSAWMRRLIPNPSMPRGRTAAVRPWSAKQAISASLARAGPVVTA